MSFKFKIKSFIMAAVLVSINLVFIPTASATSSQLNICSNPFTPTNPPCIEKFWVYGTDYTSNFGGGSVLTIPFFMGVSYTNFFGIQIGVGSSMGSGTPDPSTVAEASHRYAEIVLNLGTASENNNFIAGYTGNHSLNGYFGISSGELTYLSHQVDSNGDLLVTIRTVPYKVSRAAGIDGVSCSIGNCEVAVAKYTQFESLVTLLPIGSGYGHVFVIPNSFANGYLSTDAESASLGSFVGEFTFRGANAHYQADGSTLQSGFYKTFIPRSALIEVFGNWNRISGLSGKIQILENFYLKKVRNSILTDLVNSELENVDVSLNSDGIIISYSGFNYSTVNFDIEPRTPSGGTDGGGGTSGGGGEISTPSTSIVSTVTAPSTSSVETISRRLKTRVRLDKVESLADFTVKPGQRLKIGIKKSSKNTCSISNGRVVAKQSGECVVRVTKFTKKGKKIKRFVSINYSI